MTKKEDYLLANLILKNAKEDIERLGHSFSYDIKTKCQNYEINIGEINLTPAYYTYNSGLLRIDLNYIYNYIRDNNSKLGILSSIEDDDIKYFSILFHEIDHIYQHILYLKSSKSKQKTAYNKMNYLIEKLILEELLYYKEIYKNFHHYYPSEHEANVHGLTKSIELLDIDEIDALKKYLSFGYGKVINRLYCPFEILKTEINPKDKRLLKQFKEIEELTPYLSLYDRLSLGLKVDDIELSQIKKSKDNSIELIKKIK